MSQNSKQSFLMHAEIIVDLTEKAVDRYETDKTLDPKLLYSIRREAELATWTAQVQAVAEVARQSVEEIAATARLIESMNLNAPQLRFAMAQFDQLSRQLAKILQSASSFSHELVVPVRIYVDDNAAGPIVEDKLLDVLAQVGIVDVDGPAPILGSWYRRMFGTIKASGNTHTGNELRRAAEIQLIDRFQAGIDGTTAGAVASLIAALGNTRGAVIQSGSVLVVKVDDNIIVRQLTPEQLLHWHMNPGIFQNPVAALAELQRATQSEVGSA